MSRSDTDLSTASSTAADEIETAPLAIPVSRAHELARHDGRVEQPAEHLLRRAGVSRRSPRLRRGDGVGVAGLDLREDLPLADHQRVQPRRHAQQVPHRVAVEQHEEVGSQRFVVQLRMLLQIGHRVARRGVVVLGHLRPQGQAQAHAQARCSSRGYRQGKGGVGGDGVEAVTR